MKKDIHPKLKEMTVKCSTCSAEHTFRTTANNVSIDVCSSCHAFYTGNTSAVKSAGRVERFNNMLKKAKK